MVNEAVVGVRCHVQWTTTRSEIFYLGLEGYLQICEEFWDEFMRWAIAFARVKPDADIYDVFIWIREHQQGASPYSESFLAQIDKEIEREYKREHRRNLS